MLPKKKIRIDDVTMLEESAIQEQMKAKRETARRLLGEKRTPKDEAQAISLLEGCVAHGDTDAMVMLARCYAFSRGMKHNAERAEALISEAEKKGNDEARILMQLINHWKGKESIEFVSL